MLICSWQRAHMLITVENVEPIHDFFGAGPTSNVQEVGWRTSMELNDVHSSHSQTSTIH